MKSLWQKLMAWMTGEAKKRLVVPTIPDIGKPAEPKPATPIIEPSWDAYPCPNWMIHGEGSHENEIRQAAIDGAKAAGKTCLSINFRKPGSDDLRIHLFKWQSPKSPEKIGSSTCWTDKALREAGVNSWLVNITGVDPVYVADTFKYYAPNSDYQIRYTGELMTEMVMRILGCGSDGIKTTPRVVN